MDSGATLGRDERVADELRRSAPDERPLDCPLAGEKKAVSNCSGRRSDLGWVIEGNGQMNSGWLGMPVLWIPLGVRTTAVDPV